MVYGLYKSVIMQAIALLVPKRTHSCKHTPHYPLYIQRAIKRNFSFGVKTVNR